jgi:hypothetical protein
MVDTVKIELISTHKKIKKKKTERWSPSHLKDYGEKRRRNEGNVHFLLKRALKTFQLANNKEHREKCVNSERSAAIEKVRRTGK